MKQNLSYRAHAQRALTCAVLIALAAGPVLVAPVAAETAAPQLRLTVDTQERARLLAEQQRVHQMANSVGTNWNQLMQRWQDAASAPDEHAYANAFKRLREASEALDGQLARYEDQMKDLMARYLDLYANATHAPMPRRPELRDIGPSVADFGQLFEGDMSDAAKRQVALRIQMGQMEEALRETSERLGSSSALASGGDFVGAARMLDENLLTIEVQRNNLRAQIETVESRALWTTNEALVLTPFDPVGMDDLITQIPDTMVRFTDAPQADRGAPPPPTSAFGRLVR